MCDVITTYRGRRRTDVPSLRRTLAPGHVRATWSRGTERTRPFHPHTTNNQTTKHRISICIHRSVLCTCVRVRAECACAGARPDATCRHMLCVERRSWSGRAGRTNAEPCRAMIYFMPKAALIAFALRASASKNLQRRTKHATLISRQRAGARRVPYSMCAHVAVDAYRHRLFELLRDLVDVLVQQIIA